MAAMVGDHGGGVVVEVRTGSGGDSRYIVFLLVELITEYSLSVARVGGDSDGVAVVVVVVVLRDSSYSHADPPLLPTSPS